ncbi:PREDICTED: amyloid protein-binding protein 2-like [Vollenhovia emeryi]|uniref:amyloid protein-binding protein 2-like n=1 Tax=Vollenhovia emeryi TaxID=411798 RepID=UPI0005F415E3|nr:PREDICTED: amyloid protein-binding protein 2-like [Vollenhovia emeryi]
MDEEREVLISLKSLFELCAFTEFNNLESTSIHARNPSLCKTDAEVQFDRYYQLYKFEELDELEKELSDLNTFSKILAVDKRRLHLLSMVQAPMNREMKIAKNLLNNYSFQVGAKLLPHDELINLGLDLGKFLRDAGWYAQSKDVLLVCKQLCIDNNQTPEDKTLNCLHELLRAQTAYCDFNGAKETIILAKQILKSESMVKYCAALFTEFSVLEYLHNEYDKAYGWSKAALKKLNPTLSKETIVDILRQAAKSRMMSAQQHSLVSQKAGLLIKEAVYLARETFGTDHPKYSNVLIDYGCFLMRTDSKNHIITIYRTALDIRRKIFGENNLYVALAHKHLAYCLIESGINPDTSYIAKHHAEIAVAIMERHLPPNHFLLANAKRVKALTLELTTVLIGPFDRNILLECEVLYLSALEISKSAFNESSHLVAIQYTELSRLYQTMNRLNEAMAMIKKSMAIKTQLEQEDYELTVSIEYEAWLHFLHKRYERCESLLLCCLERRSALLGKSHSSLKSVYDVLLFVYRTTGAQEKLFQYTKKMNHWQELKDQRVLAEEPPIDVQRPSQPIADVIKRYIA